MNPPKACFYDTPVGRIGIAEQDGAVTNLFFRDTVRPKAMIEQETPLLKQAGAQLAEYFAGKRKAFDLPLAPSGTSFEQEVWAALLTIPYGETRSYQQVAKQIGRPNACRAVGRAAGRNPISIFIPCHRVVGAKGALTGYAGGLDTKQALLCLEGLRQTGQGNPGPRGEWENPNKKDRRKRK